MIQAPSSPQGLVPNKNFVSLPLFDRTSWKRVRFGDVVENCNETCEPGKAGLERFVAMEHLEPGSLHVRSWGNVADGTTFTRRCRPGQVLFGKRRAYQRKVAVAEFEAVVSGDIYVLAPNDTQRLLPELLPFLCLSERFFQHAVGTSAGSLSPRTNWSSLASFEFDLPPLDLQRRIADILWAVDDSWQAWSKTLIDLKDGFETQINSVIQKGFTARVTKLSRHFGSIPEHWKECKLEEVCAKITDGEHVTPPRTKTGVYLLSARNVLNGRLQLDDVDYISEETYRALSKRILPEPDDILISCSGSIGRVCRVPWGHRVALVRSVAILKPNAEIIRSQFLEKCLQTPYLQRQIRTNTSQLAQGNLFQGAIRQLVVPLPPQNEQEMFVSLVESLLKIEEQLRDHLVNTGALLFYILREL